MGCLGCPLCCSHQFVSVGGLRDHLLYFIYRPLQCGVCGVDVAGVHQLTVHLQEHIGEAVMGENHNVTRTLTHTCDPAPRTSSSTSHIADSAPHIADSTPHIADPTPHIADPTPHIADSTPHITDSTPNIADSTPNKADSIPHIPESTSHIVVSTPHITSSTAHTNSTNLTASRTPQNANSTTHTGFSTSHAAGSVSHTASSSFHTTGPVPNLAASTPNLSGPTSQQHNPVSHLTGPVPQPIGSVSSQTGSTTPQTLSLSQSTGPLSRQSGPVCDLNGPVSHKSGPISNQTNPTFHQANPVSYQTRPISHQPDPVSLPNDLIPQSNDPSQTSGSDPCLKTIAHPFDPAFLHPSDQTIHPLNPTPHGSVLTPLPSSPALHSSSPSIHPSGTVVQPSDPSIHASHLNSHSLDPSSHPSTNFHPSGASSHSSGSVTHPSVQNPSDSVHHPHPPEGDKSIYAVSKPPPIPHISVLPITVASKNTSSPQIPISSITNPPRHAPTPDISVSPINPPPKHAPTSTIISPNKPVSKHALTPHISVSPFTAAPKHALVSHISTSPTANAPEHVPTPHMSISPFTTAPKHAPTSHIPISVPPSFSVTPSPLANTPSTPSATTQNGILKTRGRQGTAGGGGDSSTDYGASRHDSTSRHDNTSFRITTISSHRVPEDATEQILHAYFCQMCGEKVVGKDAYFSHIRHHSLGQDEAQSWSRLTPDAPQPFNPHTANIPHSNARTPYTLDNTSHPHTHTPHPDTHTTCAVNTPHPGTHPDTHTADTPHPHTHTPHSYTYTPHAVDTPHQRTNTPHTVETPHFQTLTPNTADNPPHHDTDSRYTSTTPPPLLHSQFPPDTLDAQFSSPAGLSDGDALSSPLISTASTPGNITTDTETMNESANLSDCMDEDDTANQLLKLREWQLGKLSKSFRKHKFSFRKSPGMSANSPMSGKTADVDSPSAGWEPSPAPRSQEQGPQSQEQGPQSQELGPRSQEWRPQSQEWRPQSQEEGLQSQENFLPPSYEETTASEINTSPVEQTGTSFSAKSSTNSLVVWKTNIFKDPCPYSPIPSVSSVSVRMQNASLFSAGLPNSPLTAGSTSDITHPSTQSSHRSDSIDHQAEQEYSPAEPVTESELEGKTSVMQRKCLLPLSHSSTNQTFDITPSNHRLLSVSNSAVDETLVKSCNELQINAKGLDIFDEMHSGPCDSASQSRMSNVEPSLSTPWLPPHQSIRYLEFQPVSMSAVSSNRQDGQNSSFGKVLSSQSFSPLQLGSDVQGDYINTPLNSKEHTSEANNEVFASYNNTSDTSTKNLNIHVPMADKRKDSETLNDNTVEDYSLSECSHSPQRLILDENTHDHSNTHDTKPSSGAGDCDSFIQKMSEQKSSDTMPYLHKKFHHDQDRKVALMPSQSADVSRYIHNYQSLVVNRLNGTFSTNISFTPSIYSDQEATKKQEKVTVNQPLKTTPQPIYLKEYKCEVCGETCAGRSAYKSHYRTHEVRGQKNFTCQYCEEKFFRKCSKDLHERRHTGKRVNRCEHCQKVFTKGYALQRHKHEVHNTTKTFICVKCNRGFSTERRLQEHIEVHQRDKNHKCPQCPHSCQTASGLRTHIMERHPKVEGLKHSCDVCGEKFSKKYGLSRHKKRKHDEQHLSCNVCAKKFSCNEDLLQHAKSHNSDDSIKCNQCDKTFTTFWALQRHSETHQPNPRKFKCKKCPLQFTRRDTLKVHLRVHAQKKPYVCHCGRKFVRKSQLREHSDSHSETPRYTCHHCHRAFRFKITLRNHSCVKGANKDSRTGNDRLGTHQDTAATEDISELGEPPQGKTEFAVDTHFASESEDNFSTSQEYSTVKENRS